MSRRKVSTTVYFEPEQLERLQEVSTRRRAPMPALIRGCVDELLARDEAHRALLEDLGGAAVSQCHALQCDCDSCLHGGTAQPLSAGVPPSPLEAGVAGGGPP